MNNHWIKVARSAEVTSLLPYITKKNKDLPSLCLWRQPDKSIGAIEGFCPIGKEDLVRGKVSNDGIVCPNHSVTWSNYGVGNPTPIRANTVSYWWQTKEEYGDIFVKWR